MLHVAERQILSDYAAAGTVRRHFGRGDVSARYGAAHQLND